MKWIGLTGGIATGKSTAAKMIESLGIPIIDADKISHELSETGKNAYEKIKSHFGTNILNQDLSINRNKLGQLIFLNPQLRQDLESILHPLIKEEVKILRSHYQNNGVKICFYDVPLLFEKKLSHEFSHTVLVWCDQLTQIQRLMRRSQLSEEEANLRISSQLPMIEKVGLADYCIDNSGDLEDLEKQILQLIKTLNKSE